MYVSIPSVEHWLLNIKYGYQSCLNIYLVLNKHQTSFTSQRYRNATTLSIFIWDLKEKDINFNLKWKKIDQAASFTPITGRCNLCALEKYYLIFQPEICTLNKSDELNNFCLHKKPKLLEKTWIPRDLEDSARQWSFVEINFMLVV